VPTNWALAPEASLGYLPGTPPKDKSSFAQHFESPAATLFATASGNIRILLMQPLFFHPN
jgi:hypothetical protein